MWCKFCGQDVPGIAGPDDGQFSCARCTSVIADEQADHKDEVNSHRSPLITFSSDESNSAEGNCYTHKKNQSHDLLEITMPSVDDDWQHEQDVKYLNRLAKDSSGSIEQLTESPLPTFFNQTKTAFPNWHTHLPHSPPQSSKTELKHVGSKKESINQANSIISQLAWGILLLGVMGLVCGGVLMVWSIIAQRPVLWDLGLPVSIGSQAALLLGVILQIERIWRNHQNASNKIETVDQQISDLKETTTILSTSGSGTSNAFYNHMTRGASNELLLADLKGQMDMLTQKISK